MNIKAPKFFVSIYRDLRDQHLLIPALALIIGLIAVPVLMRNPAEQTPLPTAAASPKPDGQTSAAVLVDDTVSVRNYRKRLADLQSKNPFEQRFEVGNSGSSSGSGSSGPAATSGSSSGSSSSAGSSSTSADTSAASPTPAASADVSSADTTTPSDSTTTPTEPTQPQIRFFAGRVDVTVGPIGKGKDYDNVKYLTFLPDDTNPIAAFVGLTGSGASESAVFAITSLAEVGKGDGSCAPHKPDPCQFLTLKPGESRYVKYDGTTYRLNVRDTHVVRIADPREAHAAGGSSVADGGAGAPNGNGGTDSP